mmetsp:Transcript_31658/g.38779  ORF Transcript_31658/g.38779 Transcript_31658/m.38779 type:complete len:568 (+) Transcript_31658:368-2071(+)|eukprot:CAMPEP_0172508070 /NCGR_PEP_ID=MMETSP1066-20121228/208981_1 /TAXON_ID=671091 /ORGANISM="Coscinodiscus wailesii, Strain CCMP2513" /LENGTH=567 /DNA_ID=CAMNT_0013285885 /DNA_START=367 /DNA_END=2070 /DNA_ORIENTATION=+
MTTSEDAKAVATEDTSTNPDANVKVESMAAASDEKEPASTTPETTGGATTTGGTTTTGDSNTDAANNKRKTRDPSSHSHGSNDAGTKTLSDKYSKFKPKKQKTKFNRRNVQWDDKPQHLGSYATPEMQRLFSITVPPPPPPPSADAPKPPKRKIALLLGFVGTNYVGMQINISQRTIQAEIELALYKGGFLSSDNFGFPHKYAWSSSARTDKGVHACAQVCSCKVQIPLDIVISKDDTDKSWTERVRERVNGFLPGDIRVLDVMRVTKNFCAKTQRDKVRYQYMFPSYLLMPRDELLGVFRDVLQGELVETETVLTGRQLKKPNDEQLATLFSKLKSYRATPSQITLLTSTLSEFAGTNSFHNYTNSKPSSDPSCQRYILSFTARTIPVRDGDDVEWIETVVLGQSFLLHQIRKMTSMAIDVTRGACPPGHLGETLRKELNLIVGISPAQGLFLDYSFFELYNKRKVHNDDLMVWGIDSPEGETKGGKDKSDCEVYKRWKDFKDGIVVKKVMEEEESEFNFVRYLWFMEFRFDRDKNYLLGGKEQKEGKGGTVDDGETNTQKEETQQ